MGRPEGLQQHLNELYFQSPNGSVEIGRKQLYTQEFYSDEVRKKLREPEVLLLDEFIKVSRSIADLYTLQKAVPFYPDKLSNQEFEKAAKENPQLRSPYTYIRRDANDNFIAIPIHEIFASQIKEKSIIDSLKKAADIAGGPGMRDAQMYSYLRSRANAFQTGDWEQSEIFWLTMDQQPRVSIVIGPYDTYLDKQRGIKYAFQSWVDILNKDETEDAEKYKVQFLEKHHQKTGVKSPQIAVRVGDTIIMSGQAAEYKFSGNSLPCQPKLRQEFGSIFTIIKPNFDDQLGEKRIPAYRLTINTLKKSGVTDEQVASAFKKFILGHEICHSFTPLDANNRLGKSTQWVKELDCHLTSLVINFDLAKSRREKEIIFASFLANGYVEYQDYLKDKTREEYHLGYTIGQTYCSANRSLEIRNNSYYWEDIDKAADRVKKLQKVVHDILEKGYKRDAKKLSTTYFDDSIYKKLRNDSQVPIILRSSN